MTDQDGLKPYDLEITVAAGRDQTWQAVTQPAVLRQWFGWDYDGLAAEIQQIFVDQATFLAPEQMGWADGSYLEVVGDDAQSRVHVAREGTARADPNRYDAIEEGWRGFLMQLRFLLRARPRGVRRTIYLTGETTGRQALALVDGDWERFGSRVAWVLDDEGHLVVAAGRVPLDEPVAARFEVTVSTFGLDDAAFEACRTTWATRWAPEAANARVTVAGDKDPAG